MSTIIPPPPPKSTDSSQSNWAVFLNWIQILWQWVIAIGSSVGASLVGFLQVGTGAVLRTVQSKLQEPISVLDFGAKGGSVDDTNAFQLAINAARSGVEGGEVIVPWNAAGYTISGTVTLAGPVKLRGVGAKSGVIINVPGTTGSTFIMTGTFSEIENLAIAGAGQGNTTTAIELRATLTRVSSCSITFFGQGVWSPSGYATSECNMFNNRIARCGYGFVSNGGSINSKIDQCTFTSCDGAVIVVRNISWPTEGFTINNTLMYSCGNEGQGKPAIAITSDFFWMRNSMVDLSAAGALTITASKFAMIEGSYFSSNASTVSSCITIVGDCSTGQIINCQTHDSKGWGIQFTGVSSVITNGFAISNWSARLNPTGDLLVDGGKNITVEGANLLSVDGSSNTVYLLNNNGTNPSLYMSHANTAGGIYRGVAASTLLLKDCPGKPTQLSGTATIAAASTSVTIAHGLYQLAGVSTSVAVQATSSTVEAIGGNTAGANITLARAGVTGALTVNYAVATF